MQSLISVIVNYHNGEKYLERCIKSIINQEYKNFEIIAWDNASTDNSKKIIEKFKEEKIRYFRHPTKENLYKARNRAIEKSSGQLIAFLDSDDWWEENYLSSREKHFRDTNIDFFYSNTNIFYEKKRKKKLYRNFSLPHGKIFSDLVSDPEKLLAWHTIFIFITCYIVAQGVKGGLEKSVKFLIPAKNLASKRFGFKV